MTGRLDGVGILVTRPRIAAEALAAQLAREGAAVFVFPALEIESVPRSPAHDAALGKIAAAGIAVFVSANAVHAGIELARARLPSHALIAAVGEATAAALHEAGIAKVLFPEVQQDSEGLLALEALQDVAGREIVIFRGEGGRERLRTGLEARGARVTYVECYRRVRPQADPAAVLEAWSRGEIHAVSALSAETLDNLLVMLGDDPRARLDKATLVVPHPAVAAHKAARRFGRVLVASAGAEGIAQALSTIVEP